jgi:hypothetical protein
MQDYRRKESRMNQLTTTPLDGETLSGLPAGYEGANQSLAISLARAEVDQQITTAHAFPRSIAKAVSNITTLATLDNESAEECIYALPRGGKPIKGPSIRLAEIIASQWGNCRVGARVVHVDRAEKYVEAEGVFHDLESNTATTSRVRRRISDKSGKVLNDDMIVVTGNAACAIAKRNAILGAVPKAVWRKAYSAVEHVIAGDIKTLTERRASAMKAFAMFGVKPDQIFAALGVTGMDDISIDHIVTLTGMHSTLKSGEESVETMFGKAEAPVAPKAPPPPTAKAPAAKAPSPPPAPAHDMQTGEIIDAEPSAADIYQLGAEAFGRGDERSVPGELMQLGKADAWLEGYDTAAEQQGAK